MFFRLRCFPVVLVVFLSGLIWADTAAFDLSGPELSVTVSRSGKTLPISKIPNLQPHDRIWIHLEAPPAGESVHYLLIMTFLRGSTNPPPENWFTKVETWKKQIREEGVVVTVPEGAEQALIFLAPETGGDFGTLRSAVRGKPGAFVRASQDLNQASLDRSRLDKYLSDVKDTSSAGNALHDRSVLLARSLNIKLDNDCFQKPREQQESCLTQNTDQLVLDDGHSQSMVAALTSGSGSDLIGAISSTRLAGGGVYSPYVGAVVDLVKMMSSFRTPEYQYIPALSVIARDRVNLKLNNPPSFRKPMSVLVASLPAVESAQLPPLRPVDPNQVFCLQKTGLVLPAEGAPVVFSTEYAHDVSLRVSDASGHKLELPAKPDAASGGFVVDSHMLAAANLDKQLSGALHGVWGFDSFDGPNFHLQNSHSATWTVENPDQSALIVGRDDTIRFRSDAAACVESVSVKDSENKPLKATWTSLGPAELEVKLALKEESPSKLAMAVKQYGAGKADDVELQTYSEAAQFDNLAINAGDSTGVLTGTRLDQVAALDLGGVHLLPSSTVTRAENKDQLQLSAGQQSVASLKAGEESTAKITLRDGRVFSLQTTVAAARPKATLVSKSIQRGTSASTIRLANEDELPQDGKLTFFLKSETPDTFARTEKIEVATADGANAVQLSFNDGSLIAQDAKTVMAVLDPAKSFGPSAFGALRFRVVDGDNKGDWSPLVTLVRLPTLKEIHCPGSPDKQCTLTGTNLFLIDSVASDAQFQHAVPVPQGFAESTLSVPRPNGTLLFIKLRDDPSVGNPVALPVLPEP